MPLSPSRILNRVKVGILSYVKLAVLRNLKLRKIFENLKLKNFIVSSQNIFSTIYVWISTFNASNPGQYIHKNYKIKSGPYRVTTTWLDFLHVFFQSKRTDVHKVKTNTAQKIKSSIKDFFIKCHQIHKKLRIWSDLLKNSLMENFIFLCSEN